jgi:hypothetical protein
MSTPLRVPQTATFRPSISLSHYIVRAIDSEERADAVVDVLGESGTRRVDTHGTWRSAPEFKFRYLPALDDAFALGTAEHVDGMLLIGADDDYDDVSDVPMTRVRTDAV